MLTVMKGFYTGSESFLRRCSRQESQSLFSGQVLLCPRVALKRQILGVRRALHKQITSPRPWEKNIDPASSLLLE